MAYCRLYPPFWKPDAYVLRQLAKSLRSFLDRWSMPPYGGVDDGAQRVWPGATAVDLGCGDRPYIQLFAEKVHRYIGCDLASPAQSSPTANAAAPDVAIETNGRVNLPDRCADLVLSFQVLEHVWDLDTYLGQARRLLRPEGKLVLSTHGTWLYHPHPTDFRRWTRSGLVRELTTRGWRVESVQACVGPLAWTTQFRALGMCQILSRVPVLGSALSAVVGSFMHLRMVIEDKITPRTWIEDNACVYVIVACIDNATVESMPQTNANHGQSTCAKGFAS